MLEPVPPCTCKRSRASRMFYRTRGAGELCAIKQCDRCLGYLPMGPSEDVAVEVRAAELAAADVSPHPCSEAEWSGWLTRKHPEDDPDNEHGLTDEEAGGYLARVIYDHDREQMAEARALLGMSEPR